MSCADLKPSLIDLEAGDTATGRKQQELQRERLSEKGYTCCVYWLHLDTHTDPYSQGYVGITKNLEERLRAHKKNKRKTHLYYAIQKYKWESIRVTVLREFDSLESALEAESHYRPSLNIGWNSQRGGELGVEPEWYEDEANRDKHRKATAVATRKAIAEKDTREARSKRAKESWSKTRDKRVKAVTGENNPRAKLTEEQVKEIKYSLIPSGLSNPEIAEIYGVKPYVISFIRTGKNWSHV